MRKRLGGLVLAAALVGCGQGANMSAPEGSAGGEGFVAAPAPMAPPMEEAQRSADAPTAEPAPQPGQPPGPTSPSPVMYLAYSYQMRLELPVDRQAGLMDAHVRACQDAGPRLCQLIGSNRGGDPDSQMYGQVYLRGEPGWLRSFRENISGELDAAGGQILEQSTSTEDLTRQIVDTEARMRAMTSLRDRLQRLLDSRPGRLADLLEVERELARVQGEIDATQSTLAVMRTRVAMSELTLNYQSESQPLRGDTFRPLTEALAGFLGWIVMGLAAIITVFAVLLPWVLVFGLIAWLALRWRRRNGGRFLKRKPHPVADAPPPPT
jgi:hypothetical protein